MMFFEKIGEMAPCDVKIGEELFHYGKEVDGKFVGLRYYEPELGLKLHLLKHIPEEYRSEFMVTVMYTNSNYIPPHSDDRIKTAINIYMQPGGHITQFWRNIGAEPEKLPNQVNGGAFYTDVDNLIRAKSFTAEPGDIYLLDVSAIHSVEGPEDCDDRVVVQMATEIPYEKVLNYFV